MLVPSDDILEDIATTCLGDLRHAIAQLQAFMIGRTKYSQFLPSHSINHCISESQLDSDHLDGKFKCNRNGQDDSRDKSYSFLHGVGKLLWSELRTRNIKNLENGHEDDVVTGSSSSSSHQDLYKLDFLPDCVISSFDVPLDLTMTFIQYNYADIFEQLEKKHSDEVEVLSSPLSVPQPTYDTLDRAERLLEILSDADILYTCQFSTNLPIDRYQSTSFPKGKYFDDEVLFMTITVVCSVCIEYVESFCSRVPACSVYPITKTSKLFERINHSSQKQALRVDNDLSRQSTDSLSLHRERKLKSESESRNHRHTLIPIRRPASLDVKYVECAMSELYNIRNVSVLVVLICRTRANILLNKAKDLRDTLASSLPTVPMKPFPLSAPPQQNNNGRPHSRKRSSDPNSFSFDYVTQSLCMTGGIKPPSNPAIVNEHLHCQEHNACLPVSFLSTTELIAVVVPYLKFFLAMSSEQCESSLPKSSPPLHPWIKQRVAAFMNNLTEEAGVEATDRHAVIRIGNRHEIDFRRGDVGSVTPMTTSNVSDPLEATEWGLNEDLEEFSD